MERFKQLIIITIFLLSCSFALSQDNIVDLRLVPEGLYKTLNGESGDYYKDINGDLDKFVGNWKYQNGFEVLELEIFKYYRIPTLEPILNLPAKYHSDALGIRMKYTNNNVVIIDTLTNFDNSDAFVVIFNLIGNISLPGSSNIDNGYSIVSGIYSEPLPLNSTFDCRSTETAELKLGYETSNNLVNGIGTSGKLHFDYTYTNNHPDSYLLDEECDSSPYQSINNVVLVRQP